ncbi:ROK family protein [Kitasatospora sp. NBC_01287]|uniref:ROK family protein n=1 Tax=Kitasatospora sp. NBC_01287 TaxID=2903573 RepID=UPI00225A13E9|nr:ROK family protein [Kitasatospora sp. NBC_01287]MCX4750407.1 ROK family protein [Kitasatospora sp. NBC_01287]
MPEPHDEGECVIALDVGGTGMKGALLDRELKPVLTARRPTPRGAGPDAVLDAVTAALTTLAEQAAHHALTVRRAGVVVPGIVDEERALAVFSANLGWRDLRLADLLARRTGLPVTLGHDVRAGGYAETVLGAARGARDVLFVAIGTGISAAVISDGHPLRAGGYAGELGHLVVEPDGAPCGCGSHGCLETVAAAPAIAAAYTARSGHAVDGAAGVAALVARGDADAAAVWARASEALGAALATATTLLAPELIVLGGGLAEAGELLLAPVRAALAEHLTFQRRPNVVRAALGDEAGCLGAGLHAWQAAEGAGVPGPAGAAVAR